jgi:hypothetical protein
MCKPSVIELENTNKILDLLVNIEGISYLNIREDIFKINGPEGTNCILDVEETLVCISSEICDIPIDEPKELFKYLLSLNNKAVHGKFVIYNNKIYFKDNLEIENLDKNELEASLNWTFVMSLKGSEKISTII